MNKCLFFLGIFLLFAACNKNKQSASESTTINEEENPNPTNHILGQRKAHCLEGTIGNREIAISLEESYASDKEDSIRVYGVYIDRADYLPLTVSGFMKKSTRQLFLSVEEGGGTFKLSDFDGKTAQGIWYNASGMESTCSLRASSSVKFVWEEHFDQILLLSGDSTARFFASQKEDWGWALQAKVPVMELELERFEAEEQEIFSNWRIEEKVSQDEGNAGIRYIWQRLPGEVPSVLFVRLRYWQGSFGFGISDWEEEEEDEEDDMTCEFTAFELYLLKLENGKWANRRLTDIEKTMEQLQRDCEFNFQCTPHLIYFEDQAWTWDGTRFNRQNL